MGDIGQYKDFELYTGRVGLNDKDVETYVKTWIRKLPQLNKSFWIVRGHQHRSNKGPMKRLNGQYTKEPQPVGNGDRVHLKYALSNDATLPWFDHILTFTSLEQFQGFEGPGCEFGL